MIAAYKSILFDYSFHPWSTSPRLYIYHANKFRSTSSVESYHHLINHQVRSSNKKSEN